MQNFRDQLWLSKLMDRQPRQEWQAAGAKDMAVRVGEEVVRILESHQPKELDGAVRDELIRIRKKGEKILTPTNQRPPSELGV